MPETDTEKHSIETAAHIGPGEIRAELDASFDPHAEPAHHLHFGECCLYGLAQHDDAVGGEAPREFPLLEQSDAVAKAREIAGTRQPCRACANHCHFETIRRACPKEIGAIHVVRGIALEPPDRDRLVFVPEHAGALAQLLNRTDSRAGRAEDVRFEDCSRRAGQIPGGNLLDESRNVYVRGTGVCAGRVVAVQAPACFHQSFMTTQRRQLLRQLPAGPCDSDSAIAPPLPGINAAYSSPDTPHPTNHA